MIFGPVPVAEAEGTILAHSLPVATGRLRKGRVLTADDIAALIGAGHEAVTVARLEGGDLHEDAAAMRLAEALVPDPAAHGLRIGPAATGRVNLHATGPGLLRVDAEAIAAMNAVDPTLTFATHPPLTQVAAGQLVGTVKVITYAAAEEAVQRACDAGQGAVALIAPTLRRIALIETQVGDVPPPKGAKAVAGRLAALGAELSHHVTCAHTEAAVADALRDTGDAEAVLILTASATSDPRDVAPAALVAAGGRLTRYGMPVDPGNLLFLGELSGRPVIGLPGCARSPALNGADFVLSRVICGVPVTDVDIAAMGVGGLLKEIPQRGRPREG